MADMNCPKEVCSREEFACAKCIMAPLTIRIIHI